MIVQAVVKLAGLLLKLRYRVTVTGLDAVAQRGRRGILFLPNHQALIDPVILLTRLWGRFRPRPLADRDQVDRFFIRRMARRLGAVTVPDAARPGWSEEEVKRALDELAASLQRGENVLLYPAGKAQRQRWEELSGTSAAPRLLQRVPDARVVLIRQRGLWGSRFSYAAGTVPSVARALLHGAKGLLASGIFFAPKREVQIELIEPDDLPREADGRKLNRYLEALYNVGAEPNTYVPYSRWERGGVRELPEPAGADVRGDAADVPPEIREAVRAKLRELTCWEQIADGDDLGRDLGVDSLTAAELMAWLGEEYGFAPSDPSAVRTVGDVMLVAWGEPVAGRMRNLLPVPRRWFALPPHPAPPEGLAEKTVPEALLDRAAEAPQAVLCADQTSSVRTRRELVLALFALRGHIARLPGERVGIMLPASVAAMVTYLATLLAGKTPVMVNWTLGRRNLLHALNETDTRHVLTARALADRLAGQGMDLSGIEQRLVYVEDLRNKLTRRDKLLAWLRSRGRRWPALRRQRVSETAAILFTSGSESVPKAVPLTHRNVLTNVADARRIFPLRDRDVLLGMLPPFHAFGLTVGVILPAALGLRVVFSPDPTDAATLAEVTRAYRPTMLVGTPTFLRGITRAGSRKHLTSLSLIVTGAEACPPRVQETLGRKCPQAVVLEGYGITECSPIVAVNRPEAPRWGTIGPVVPSLEHVVVHPETRQPVGPGERGELLVRGPS
ncbi:MAG: AMP-binding protein, partial [Planctomycetota bacterium]